SGRHTAHQHYPSEVTIRYRFHPLRGSCFPVIRLHYVYEEPCYVVRRPNGSPLSFPVWMTESRAAQIEIVCEPRLTLSTLLDLRHLVTLYLSSLGSADSEGIRLHGTERACGNDPFRTESQFSRSMRTHSSNTILKRCIVMSSIRS